MKKEIMHVAIMDSMESRKDILSSAVSAIQCLKDFERLRVVRKQKRVYRNELFKNINAINDLFSKIELPRVDYEDTKIVKNPKKKQGFMSKLMDAAEQQKKAQAKRKR